MVARLCRFKSCYPHQNTAPIISRGRAFFIEQGLNRRISVAEHTWNGSAILCQDLLPAPYLDSDFEPIGVLLFCTPPVPKALDIEGFAASYTHYNKNPARLIALLNRIFCFLFQFHTIIEKIIVCKMGEIVREITIIYIKFSQTASSTSSGASAAWRISGVYSRISRR